MNELELLKVAEAAQQLGRLGGQATKKKYGKEHYQKLAKHMNKVLSETRKLEELK